MSDPLHAGANAPAARRANQTKLMTRNENKKMIGLFWTLGAGLGTGLLAVFDPLEVKRTAHDVITHTGQILDTTPADQNHGVLLQVVPLTANIGNHLVAIGKTHSSDLTQGGVWLFRGGGIDTGTYPAALWTVL